MFKKNVPQVPDPGQANETRLNLSRRTFLRAALVGAGALALPTLEVSRTLAAPPQQGGTGTGSGSGSGGTGSGSGSSAQPFNPATAKENWMQPWEWRTSDWPGEQVDLNVVPNAAPVAIFGNPAGTPLDPGTFLFSYNGISPGPTIRVGGDEALLIKVRNMLGPNVDDFCRPEHTMGLHQHNTTNLHVHGLHVQPTRNADGSASDNVLLRIMPRGDYALRQNSQSPACWPLDGNEVVGEANYKFLLGRSGAATETHPPGTFWYHPHPHGATYAQVAGGMVGFLLVEGDVDEALKAQIPNYKERLMAIQQIQLPQPPTPPGQPEHFQTSFSAVNGQAAAAQRIIVMKPGAIERWRVLNGNVDGKGYTQFMVLDQNKNPQDLYLLAVDGVTLVRMNPTTNMPEHYIKKLDKDKSLVMAPANRADFLFKAPPLNGQTSLTFTIVANSYAAAVDGGSVTTMTIATVVVRDDHPTETLADIDLEQLTLPEVPQALYPVSDAELLILAEEAQQHGNPNVANKLRTRQVLFSGWGKTPSPQSSATRHTMAIDCQDFDPTNPGHTMLLNTAEEWTIWNCSTTVKGPPGHSSVDHPMHIHINPVWITKVFDGNNNQIDLNGNLSTSPNYDFEPRWQDTIRLPRNGGRVVFRSRFLDFTGQFVHHCHILLHEDNGMMQAIQVVANPQLASYVAKDLGYEQDPGFKISPDECNGINELDQSVCQTVLSRLRQPAS